MFEYNHRSHGFSAGNIGIVEALDSLRQVAHFELFLQPQKQVPFSRTRCNQIFQFILRIVIRQIHQAYFFTPLWPENTDFSTFGTSQPIFDQFGICSVV